MLEIIRNIFGDAVQETPYSFPAGTPYYIRHGYRVSRLSFRGKSCLLAEPERVGGNLASMKKHVASIQQLCQEPVVLYLRKMTSLQRANLIESEVAFIGGQNQLFIPFWGSFFEEKIKTPVEPSPRMSANAQLVFLYLFYHSDVDQKLNQTQIGRDLGLSKPSCSRAVQLLNASGLISLKEEGTSHLLSLAGEKSESLREAMSVMGSPVLKRVYVKSLPTDIPYKLSGIKALADGSMLATLPTDAGYAVSKENAKLLQSDIIIDEQTFRDFGGEIIEVWKYDPFLLSETSRVDDASLLLCLDDETDERVQKELDELREKLGINEGGDY